MLTLPYDAVTVAATAASSSAKSKKFIKDHVDYNIFSPSTFSHLYGNLKGRSLSQSESAIKREGVCPLRIS